MKDEDSPLSSDNNDNDIKLEQNHNSDGSIHHPDSISLQMADGLGAISDSESTYGDTLTQTSITKLLSKKFKVSDVLD